MASAESQIALVSSGAVGSSEEILFQPLRHVTDRAQTEQLQASIGQSQLMSHWINAFVPHRMNVSQHMLTHHGVKSGLTTIRNAMLEGIVPIINANDGISDEELHRGLGFGDNDTLSQLVATAMNARLLVLLTDTKGVLDETGRIISDLRVEDMEEGYMSGLCALRKGSGSGGMLSKLKNAREFVSQTGGEARIACGKDKNALLRICNGGQAGTRIR